MMLIISLFAHPRHPISGNLSVCDLFFITKIMICGEGGQILQLASVRLTTTSMGLATGEAVTMCKEEVDLFVKFAPAC